MDGGVSFDGRAVRPDGMSVVTGEGSARVDAALALIVREPRVDARVRGDVDVAALARWAGDGMRVDGRLSF